MPKLKTYTLEEKIDYIFNVLRREEKIKAKNRRKPMVKLDQKTVNRIKAGL